MIDLYFFPSPNTWKASIMLEECGLAYRVVPIDITKDEQFAPAFLAISPNNRVPAIVDHDGPAPQPVFESGAILLYLAEKTGRFLAPAGPARIAAFEWLMWQTGGLGPMAGQAHHFRRYKADGNSYAIERYTSEAARLYGVLDRRLAWRSWIAGAEYSIADIACWGWVWFHRMHGQHLDSFPEVKRWFLAMSERPAVQRGKAVGLDLAPAGFRAALEGPFYAVEPDFGAGDTQVR